MGVEAREVRMRLDEAAAQIPVQPESVGNDAHELALGERFLEKGDHLHLEEVDRIDRWTTHLHVAPPDSLAHEAKVERAFQGLIEVVLGNQLLS